MKKYSTNNRDADYEDEAVVLVLVSKSGNKRVLALTTRRTGKYLCQQPETSGRNFMLVFAPAMDWLPGTKIVKDRGDFTRLYDTAPDAVITDDILKTYNSLTEV